MTAHQIAFLRPAKILQEFERCPLAYWPLGPLEWHGPHLPLGTDPLNAEKVSLQAAEISGGLVFPTFYWGTERERDPATLKDLGFEQDKWIIGMDFPANSLLSHYASEEVFAILVREQLRLMSRMAFKVILIISGHAAANQMQVLARLAAEFSAQGKVKVLVVIPICTDEDGVKRIGHASRKETALMMAHFPETVSLETLPPLPQPLRNVDFAIVDDATFSGSPLADHTVRAEDDPRHASQQDGEKIVRMSVVEIVMLAQKALREAG
jgi:creatinine amidohydrolase